jgi:hypothetical protein
VRGSQFGTYIHHSVIADAEFTHNALWFNFRLGEVAALGFRHVFNFCCTPTELQSGITIPFHGPLRNDLQVIQLQNRYWHMAATVRKDAAHANLSCY